jgi:hypothetical protein
MNLHPITNSLTHEYIFVDNELQESLNRLGFWSIFSRHGIPGKRTGYPVRQVVFTLLVWVFLNQASIRSFLGKFVGFFFNGGKDVLYDFLKREDINWRGVDMELSKSVYSELKLDYEQETAFVVDDSIKQRRGKKVEGTSTHFDHTEGRCVMGQQVVQLGLSWPGGFVPVDSQIYIGEKNVHSLNGDFKDGRSAVAKDYEAALMMSKHEILEHMLKRSARMGIKAKYILGDSWYGCRKNIRIACDLGLIAVFRMKRGNLKYRLNGKEYTLAQLYYLIKRRLEKNKGCKWKTAGLQVELDISENGNKPEWLKVRLVFSCPRNPKKDEWAAFLCTDLEMCDAKVLETYALRWGIEVFFKEAKQNMGLLKEQTGNYACHYASIHLTSIRYLLLFDSMKKRGADKFGQIRDEITGKLEWIAFSTLLWELFKAIIYGVLDQFEKIGKEVIKEIKEKIQESIMEFFEKTLQLDGESLKMEQKAEKFMILS